MSYPVESERGLTFAMQWSLLNIGAALGGLITLIQTLQNGNQQAVGTGTYVAFVVIVIVGLFSLPSHLSLWVQVNTCASVRVRANSEIGRHLR